MKILHIITVGRVVGGAEKNMFIVNGIHRRQGNDVRVLSSDLYEEEGLESDYIFKALPRSFPLKYLYSFFNPYAYQKIRHVLNEFDPDIVHLHTLGQVSPLALLPLRKRSTVTHLHGPDEFIPGLLLWYMQARWFNTDRRDHNSLTTSGKFVYISNRYIRIPLYQYSLKRTTYIAPSQYMKEMAENNLQPVVLLRSGVELKRYHRYVSGGPILFVGRVEKVKGLDILIDSMAKVIREVPQVQLVIIRSGPYETTIQKKIVANKLEDNVQLLGWIERKKIDKYYIECSMVVIPSVWPENFPSVCNEAMSIGRPVVATRVGGVPELINNNKNGLLVPPEDAEALADAVLKLCKDESLAECMGRRGYEATEALEFEKHSKQLMKIYKTVERKTT